MDIAPMKFRDRVESATFNLLGSSVTAYVSFYPKGHIHNRPTVYLHVSGPAKVEASLDLDGNVFSFETEFEKADGWGKAFLPVKDKYSKIIVTVRSVMMKDKDDDTLSFTFTK